MIELKNLTKVYETVNYNVIALSDINYKLEAGEVVVLLGRSGSGKSTLLNILGGFDRDYAGSFFLGGENMKEKTEREIDTIRKRRIGFVFQQYVLLNNLTVIENVELALKVIGVVNNGSRRRASLHALKLVGLREHADKYPYELSGGQKQRVAIARAFVKNPDIIIADEPTAALDSRTGNEVLDLLRDLCRTKLLIIATHNKAIVRDYGSRVIELKSGYTIKNELITDASLVKVDEIDLIIDKEIKSDNEIIKKIIDIEKHVEQENKATVLKDLGVDLQNFRLNRTDEFSIDDELKKDLIKERMRNSKLNTRIYRFLQTSDDFFGKKKYANKAFLRNIGLHLFSSLIFTVFLLTIVFGLNFVTETFGGFNEKAMYTRTMNNENVLFFATDEFEMEEKHQNLYEDLETPFISDFTQTEIVTSKFLDDLLLDPYFRYQYEQEQIKYIYSELEARNLEKIFAIYYNNSSIILRQENEEIIFDDLKYTYQNIVTNPEPYTYVTEFMGTDLDESLIYQFNFVYTESNEEILSDHLLEGSVLPATSSEVVVPVAYLFDYEILNPDDFKDEFGNILEIIPSYMISEAFLALPVSERTLEITRNVITFTDEGSTYTEDYDTLISSFEIVGLINFDGDINPFLEMRDDIFIANNASTNFSFIFSQEAEDLINFLVIDNTSVGTLSKSIQYAEISKENYEEYEVDLIVKEFEETYITDIKETIGEQFNAWITTLNQASALISVYIEADLAGEAPNGDFLEDIINNSMFPGLRYQDLLNYYIAQHMSVISDRVEFNYLCPSCNVNTRVFSTLLVNSETAYGRAKLSSQYVDLLENYGDPSRLTYQESTNRVIYEYYGHLFNNQFYESYEGDYYSLELVSSFEREFGSILSLVFLVVPRFVLEMLPFVDKFVIMMENLESSPGFINFMESTNLDLLISSISTNAIRSLVMVVLYVVVYFILLLSVIFLSIVLINLYGNIYETATRKRIKELASLRVLGTSYDDIYDMVRLENKRVALFSYGSFVAILYALGNLNLFIDAPIKHYYMPLLGLFFDFNLFDVFVMNYIVLITVTIIFYFFIYKYIIKRVSTKKLSNIDTIRAIRDGENL
ncbi:MAG: putative ABC transporter ATP-binding protein [Candidatus Izimaplasma bacterium HR2]|nr:MAG: putative ABC transporter ATP-binding protein [Candidatus Izimaplasma bacterium HR2]